MAEGMVIDVTQWFTKDMEVLHIAMGVCGIAEITEATWQKDFDRIFAYERIVGAFRFDAITGEHQPYTPTEIHTAIGTCSGFGTLTEDEFAHKLYRTAIGKAREERVKFWGGE